MCRTAGGNGGNGEKTVVVYIGCFYTYTIKCRAARHGGVPGLG